MAQTVKVRTVWIVEMPTWTADGEGPAPKDLLGGAKSDTAHVKRIVLACERDMEERTEAEGRWAG